MKILIAEDDATSRRMLSAVLSKWGYEVIATDDGAQAGEALQQPGAPRLAILDGMMPEMDGIEVCRRVRAIETRDPPYIIMLTSMGEHEDIVAGLDAGANDYVSKPHNNAELRARVSVGQRMLELQSEANAARDALAHEAMHDPLTGILNRRAIKDMLRKELARAAREGQLLSIGMCDIDHFKRVNDTYGHQVGDDVLCGFVQRIQSRLRGYDHLGRYGGEEFLVITPGASGAAGTELYQRLCEGVADGDIQTRSGNVTLTVSIGVAQGAGEDAMDAILAAADSSLYDAKHNGRNRTGKCEIGNGE
jgi:two-component system, cell cycle response regulator